MNLQAQARTRATQIAASELKQIARDAGTCERDFRISDRRKAIAEHIRNNPRIVERAAMEVAAWRSKFTSGAKAEQLKTLRIFCAPLVFKIQPMEIEDDHRLCKS